MSQGPTADHRGERTLLRRALRGLLGALLLFGPLVVCERLAQSDLRWLRPVLDHPRTTEHQRLAALQREACPALVSFGTSVADNALRPFRLRKLKPRGRKLREVFTFAAPGVRPSTALAQYRWLKQRGCTPRYIAVEVSPVMLNGEHNLEIHDSVFMSARAQLGMPAGWAELRGYNLARQLELATYDRLFIHRARKILVERSLTALELESWALSAREWEEIGDEQLAKRERAAKYLAPDWEPPLDGRITSPRKGMSEAKWAKERRRVRRYRSGFFEYVPNRVEKDAIVTLAREAAGEGATVLLHAPPPSSLYLSIEAEFGMDEDYAAFADELDALAAELERVVWYDGRYAPGYERADFKDWVHLSKRGEKRYLRALWPAFKRAINPEGGR